ncbi:MAG: amidohydrolase family protein, partial [Alphaproteobacteria bacterium]|nr:amidohydrolase family protein [Alphaproteobacteria bacterium]
VLSHGAPSTQKLDAELGPKVAAAANDRLKEICDAYPDRLAGFAALGTADPIAAANELERAIDKLGFKGAMIHGLTGGELFIDHRRFWPIFERAQALDVPLYLHPALPHKAVIDIYLKDYAEKFPGVLNAGWGFTLETATAAIRLVLSGVLEKYPGVKIVLGHLGETLPFLLWRIDMALNRPGNDGVAFRDLFCAHFHVTTSGFFSDPALLLCIQELGVDRILFAVDYPFVPNPPGPQWMERLMLSTSDKAKILHGNSERLLKM